jgi:hypothetical protein
MVCTAQGCAQRGEVFYHGTSPLADWIYTPIARTNAYEQTPSNGPNDTQLDANESYILE